MELTEKTWPVIKAKLDSGAMPHKLTCEYDFGAGAVLNAQGFVCIRDLDGLGGCGDPIMEMGSLCPFVLSIDEWEGE